MCQPQPQPPAARRRLSLFKVGLAARPLTREHVGVVFDFFLTTLPLTQVQEDPDRARAEPSQAKPSRSCNRFTSPATKRGPPFGLSKLCRETTSELSNTASEAFSGVKSGRKGVS